VYVASHFHSHHILHSLRGPPVAGLSGFAVFVSVASIVLSLFMLLVPVVYEKYDKLARLARALKEVRVGFILNGSGTVLNLLIAYVCLITSCLVPLSKRPSTPASLQQSPLGHSPGVRIPRRTPMLGIVTTVSKTDCPIGVTPNELVPYFSGLVSFSGPHPSC